jgi:hypothetical protein
MITLEKDCKSFSQKKLLHANELLNEIFCNVFLKIFKKFPMHHIHFVSHY